MPAEVTIDVGLPDGRRTGPIPASMMKAALAVINKEPDPDQPAMFSSAETGEDRVQAVAQGQLKAIIQRIERLEEDKKQIGEDIKDVYAEAKGTGFDTVALRALIKLRKMDSTAREEAEAILDLYKSALGMT